MVNSCTDRPCPWAAHIMWRTAALPLCLRRPFIPSLSSSSSSICAPPPSQLSLRLPFSDVSAAGRTRCGRVQWNGCAGPRLLLKGGGFREPSRGPPAQDGNLWDRRWSELGWVSINLRLQSEGQMLLLRTYDFETRAKMLWRAFGRHQTYRSFIPVRLHRRAVRSAGHRGHRPLPPATNTDLLHAH